MAGITARLEHHQGAVCGVTEQHVGKVPGTEVDQLHPIAQVLQQVAHAHGQAALGLKTCNKDPALARQALGHVVPGRALAVLVHAHQGGHFQFQAAAVVAGVLALAVIVQAVAHQPRAIAQVALQVLLKCLEVGITQGAAKPPDTGFADAQLGGDAGRGLERQFVQVGEHVGGDLAA